MKMNSAWLQLAALVAVACLFQYGTEASPVPAPPDAREESQASPPITEDELNLMIERLLMEAYGDEYEPPPPTRIKTKPQSSRAEVDESKVKAAVRIKTVRQPPKNVDPFQIAADAISSSKTFTEEHRRAKDISNVNVPNKIISGAIVPTQTITFNTPPKFLDTTPSSSLKQLNVETAGKENNKLPNQIVFDIPPHLTTPTNDVTVTTPKSPTPGIISPEELKKAVVLEQVGHPKVLIVDRRTKQKSSNSGVNNRATSLTSGQAVAQLSSPAQISEINNKFGRKSSSGHGPSLAETLSNFLPPNPRLNQQTTSTNLTPKIQPAKLLTRAISEDNRPFKHVQITNPSVTKTSFLSEPSGMKTLTNLFDDQGSVPGFISTEPSLTTISRSDTSTPLTVGDLVRSLNGQNGIKVISLNTNADSRQQQHPHDADVDGSMLQRLRNALISENIEVNLEREQRQLSGLFDSSVGVPLPLFNSNTNSQSASSSQFGGNIGSSSSNTLGNTNSNTDDILANIPLGNFGSTVDDIINGQNTGFSASSTINNDPLASLDLDFDFGLTTDTSSSTNLDSTDSTTEDYEDYDYSLPALPAQPPNIFRTGISDILFTKGQWFGTLIGGLIDIGTAVGDGVTRLMRVTETSSST